MPRRHSPLRIIEEFVPDKARCAAALVRLLSWQSPAETSGTAQDAASGEAPQEEPID
jgi:hypothetical protein